MTTQRESRTEEGRLSWLEGAYTQVNERLGDLARGQEGLSNKLDALTETVAALASGQAVLVSKLDALTETVAALAANQAALQEAVAALATNQAALASKQDALTEEVAAQARRLDAFRAEVNSRFNTQNLFQGAIWATVIGGFITLFVTRGGA